MRIVFKRENDESPDLMFVEIEDDNGRSIEVGQWSNEGDGFHVLEIPDQPPVLLNVTATPTSAEIHEFIAAYYRKAVAASRRLQF